MNCITDVKDKISKLIIKAYQHKASDLFIRENMYPYIRNSLGKIEMLEDNFIKDSQMISFLEKVQQQLTIDDLDNDFDEDQIGWDLIFGEDDAW